MKTITAKLLIILALMLFAGPSGLAKASIEKIKPLSGDSKELKMTNQAVSATVINEIQRIKTLIAENESKFSLLINQENADMSEIYKNMDESALLRTQLSKFRRQLIKIALFK